MKKITVGKVSILCPTGLIPLIGPKGLYVSGRELFAMILVGPREAEALLDGQHKNRKQKKLQTDNLKYIVKKNMFVPWAGIVHFTGCGESARLNNGQHRLHNIIETETAQYLLAVFNVHPEAVKVLDQVTAARTHSDIFMMLEIVDKYHGHASAMVKRLAKYDPKNADTLLHVGGVRKVSQDLIDKVMESGTHVRDTMEAVHSVKAFSGFNNSALCTRAFNNAVIFLLAQSFGFKEVEHFFAQVMGDIKARSAIPRELYIALTKLKSGEKVGSQYIPPKMSKKAAMAYLVQAARIYFGKTREKLEWKAGKEFPKLPTRRTRAKNTASNVIAFRRREG